jgi:FixJ family two-component response regulator
MRLAFARVLRGSSYQVALYDGGEEFMRSLTTSLPACVVLDVHMPALSGVDVQRALALAKIELPVIVVTGRDQPELKEQCLAEGAVAYFTKPLRREELIAALDTATKRDT